MTEQDLQTQVSNAAHNLAMSISWELQLRVDTKIGMTASNITPESSLQLIKGVAEAINSNNRYAKPLATVSTLLLRIAEAADSAIDVSDERLSDFLLSIEMARLLVYRTARS